MQKKQVLSFALSQEELFVALSYLKSREIAGLEIERLTALSDKEQSLVLGVAERALIARGFLIREPNMRLNLVAPVLAVLGSCANPETSVILSITYTNSHEEQYYFHSARKMRVIHTIPSTTIHQFMAVEDNTAMIHAILSALSLADVQTRKLGTGKIAYNSLERARDIALEEGSFKAKEILSEELEMPLAEAFAEALTGVISNATIVVINQDDIKESQGFSILKGEESLWLMSPSGTSGNNKTSKIKVQAVSSNEVVELIQAIYAH